MHKNKGVKETFSLTPCMIADPSFTIGAYNTSPSNQATAAWKPHGLQFPHDFDAPKEWTGVRDLVPDSMGSSG